MAGAEGRKSKPMGRLEAAAGRDRDMCGGWVIYYTFCHTCAIIKTYRILPTKAIRGRIVQQNEKMCDRRISS